MGHVTLRFRFLALCLISGLLPAVAVAQLRVALVIGNADYKEAPLRNPLNDARDIAQALRDLEFEVIEVNNAAKKKMLDAVNDFGVRLQQAHVSLFYYSGHGVQYQGKNYLIPIQATIAAPADLEQETVDAQRILGRMEQSQTALNLVILDACRNNPFRNLIGFRSFGERGLAQLPRVRSSLIAYATQPDNVAEDGLGRNGTYTKHLLRYLKQPGLSLPDLFSEVGRVVLQETNGKQEPWVAFSPLPRFCLAGCAPSSLPASPPPTTGASGTSSQVSAGLQSTAFPVPPPSNVLPPVPTVDQLTQDTVPNIEGRYDLISGATVFTDNSGERYDFMAATMIIKRITNVNFGFVLATKAKNAKQNDGGFTPNGKYGFLSYKNGEFHVPSGNIKRSIDGNQLTVNFVFVNAKEQYLLKKVDPKTSVSLSLRKTLTETEKNYAEHLRQNSGSVANSGISGR